MDSVRFGRALGIGARSAAKALAGAADAAHSPNPTPVKRPTAAAKSAADPHHPAASPQVMASPIAGAARSAARATVKARRTGADVARGGKQFGRAAWKPLVKFSGVLWLEITGAFFGLFTLFAGQAAWLHHNDLRATATNHDDHLRALAFLAMAIVFGYFSISNFVRARRLERRS